MEIKLLEFVDSRGLNLKVNREQAVVEGVKILGRTSRNNREYAESAIRGAVSLYEGKQSYVNHPAKGKENEPRPYSDLIGTMRGVHVREGELYGNFHYNPKHALAEQFAWDAEHNPGNLGFSHVAQGRSAVRNGKTIIESILSVQSVDLVTAPATTNGLFESVTQTEANAVLLKEATLDQLKTERPDLLKAVLESHANGEAAKAQAAELAKLQEQIKTLEAEKATALLETTIAKEIADAKLPEKLVTEAVKKSLRALDAAARNDVIAALQEAAKVIPNSSKPQSKEQRVTEGAGSYEGNSQAVDTKSLARAFRN